MIVCTLCGETVALLACVMHADEHIRTLVKHSCRVTYDIVYDDDVAKIIIMYSPLG